MVVRLVEDAKRAKVKIEQSNTGGSGSGTVVEKPSASEIKYTSGGGYDTRTSKSILGGNFKNCKSL